jgi:hypothetical protein
MDVSRTVAVANQLIGLANELLVNAGQAPAEQAESWRTETGFPKLKVFDGATLMLYSPINPAWKPSMAAQIFGAQGAHVNDPSVPVGARSPMGFPMVRGSVLYGDSAFANDADVQKYMQAVAAQNPDTSDAPKYTGKLHSYDLTLYDWAFYFQKDLEMKQAIIFAEKPRYEFDGKAFVVPDAEFRDVDTSAYAANGGVLAQFA